ncbi:uncharacterized protein KY384_000921 [Bacidia gigantensis]|uniref:uncharacterized protein n=1 Tax=Bacidia gigantensis TaxID=2732470 RepID=UPI001D04C9CC|nr:uncharacterized protein KY384_000921 [Bacidia gigantensis]KAG8534078.1 hypothetical protein KY384_000921 [Bacidia gigantensis]
MPPKKRRASGKQAASKSKQPKQDGQKAVSHDINVPLDEGFKDDINARIYIDDEGVIFDASLNQTNIGGNNNKFYRLQLLVTGKGNKYYTHTRWGRVGEFGAVKTMGPFDLEAALKEYEKKFKDKSGHKWEDRGEPAKKGKYTFIEKSYESDDDDDNNTKKEEVKQEDDDEPEIESKLPIKNQRMVELIFNQNHFNSVLENIGYNANKLPLGKLSKTTLKQGFEHLHELASLIKHPKLAENKYSMSQQEAIEDFSNKYYSTIPHEFGRNRPPAIADNDTLRKEISMLDTLTDMEVANTIMKSTGDKKKDADNVNMLDKRFNELKLKEMTALDHKSDEYKALSDYLIKFSGTSHGFKFRLEDIFRIDREGEADRFGKSDYSKLKKKNRMLLWHGSRVTNFGGILSQGLRIAPPEAPVSGYAFGKLTPRLTPGTPYMSGGTGLLLLIEAELGRPMYEIPTGDSNAGEECKKHGYHGTLGVGRTAPLGWMDGGSIHPDLKGVQIPDSSKGLGDNKKANANGYLQFNEYIAYNVEQLRMRYLVRVGM